MFYSGNKQGVSNITPESQVSKHQVKSQVSTTCNSTLVDIKNITRQQQANNQETRNQSNEQLKFWKFLSNLPTSILQRRKSSLSLEVEAFLNKSTNSSTIERVNEPVKSHITRDRKAGDDDDDDDDDVDRNQIASSFSVSKTKTKSRGRKEEKRNKKSNICLVSTSNNSSSSSLSASSSSSSVCSTSSQVSVYSSHEESSSLSANNKIKTKIADKNTIDQNNCEIEDKSRLRWNKKLDFLLSIIGFAVDLANIWRFPYLCYKNGGGVFLIPYLAMLVFGGIPLFFLELLIGQYVKKGPLTVWDKICPPLKGVGYCSVLISWYVSFYYNVLIAWSVYFIYRSFSSIGSKMPWQDCDNPWNSNTSCLSISRLSEICNSETALRDYVNFEDCRRQIFTNKNVTSPAQEFFVKELSQLDQSSGFDDMGSLRPELVLCLIIVYLLHYFSLFRGLETSGKVVWVTATAPYLILSILLVRGLFLPGAAKGIEYYLSPNLEKLADPKVWIDAANQVFYSIGVGFGVHLTYASFNTHNNNCYVDCLVTSAVNALTSVYSGLVVFVYLGYMSTNLGIEIDKVASEGYSLVFEVYPEALTTLPFARFWTVLFFIMLLTLGIDSAMGGLESVITGLEDEFAIFRKLSRAQLTGLVVASSFLPALISCTQGGAYSLFWFDIYSAGTSLLFAAFFETLGVVYFYGLDKFIPNIESMLHKKPPLFCVLCWKYISPLFLGIVIIMSLCTVVDVPTYRNYVFPLWSIVLGWLFTFSSVIAIPVYAAIYYASKKYKSNNSKSADSEAIGKSDIDMKKMKSGKQHQLNSGVKQKKCQIDEKQQQTSITCSSNHKLTTSKTKTKLQDKQFNKNAV